MSKFESTEQFTSKNCDEIKMKRKSNLKLCYVIIGKNKFNSIFLELDYY